MEMDEDAQEGRTWQVVDPVHAQAGDDGLLRVPRDAFEQSFLVKVNAFNGDWGMRRSRRVHDTKGRISSIPIYRQVLEEVTHF